MRVSHRSLIAVGVVTALAASAGTAFAATTAESSSSTSVSACRTTQLQVWRGEPGDGTTGSVFYELEFSNVSSTTCSLTGYPRVVAVDAHGNQLGSASSRDHRFAPTTVVLRPRSTAHAVLRITDVGAFPTASCNQTTASAIEVFPPNRPRAATVPLRFRACATAGPSYLSVRVIRPRVGIPGVSE